MELHKPSHESAYIITHKHPITQPNFLEFTKEIENRADSDTQIKNISSEIQKTAFILYDMGLNPFPLPHGKKSGYPWKQLQYTRLDRNDEQYGLYTLFSGQCNIAIMCGRTSRNLFVIDCESHTALNYHIQQLRQRNIPLWVTETGRGGHIYLFCHDGEVNNVPSGILKDAEVRGKNGYVLAPPSLHPRGKAYSWLYQETDEPPTISIQTIDWLCDVNGKRINLSAHQSKSITQVKTRKHPYSPLSRRTRDYIHNGHDTPEGSRNNELFRASCDMAGNNFTQQQTFSTLASPAQSSGLSTREIQATIRSAYSQTRSPSRPQLISNNSNNPDWQWAMIFGDAYAWQGRTATSQRAIFTALIHRAKVSSNEDGLFRASIREIASLARVGTATVQRILKSFQEKDKILIIKCGHDKTSNATLWKFPQKIILEAQELNPDTLKESPQWLSCSVSNLSQPDAIERQALGYNGLLVYRAMVDYGAPLLPKALAKITNLACHQVKYVLKKLLNFELIYRADSGWVAHVYTDLELDMKIQEKRDIIGKGQQRAMRFQKERAVYAGRYLFYARLRYEREMFKGCVYKSLRLLRHAKYGREKFLPSPVYREIPSYKQDKVEYQRVTLEELDEDDMAWIECALSLGAEVIISDE